MLYPVAEYDLQTFMELDRQYPSGEPDVDPLMSSLQFLCFSACLSNALAYIHQHLTKHMDIKPKNILVGSYHTGISFGIPKRKIYIADFGIARSYSTIEAAETEGLTACTRKYAAPEVVEQDKRGFPADFFSMGCVFVEMLATYMGENDAEVPNDYYAA